MNFDRPNLDRIYRYCLALSGQRDAACDLLQGAIEKYLQKTPRAVQDPVAYICRLARNRFIDQQRRAGTVQFEPLGDPEAYAGVESELEQTVIDQFTLERVWSRFTPAEREVLYLWAVEEMTAAEIALKLGQPRATVLSRLQRARARIQATVPAGERLGGTR